MTQKIIATIEARMTSTRLPGKVLLEVLEQPLLLHMIKRIKRSQFIDEIVVACTDNYEDDPIQELCELNEISFFRGSENNVLQRVLEAAQSLNGDIIVELTGDCPLIDVEILDQAIQIYLHNRVDYVSNGHIRSYPDGMDVQVFSTSSLENSSKLTSHPDDLEHVSLFMRNNPKLFSKINIISPPETFYPELGLTLDTIEDFQLIKEIILHFQNKNIPSCREIIEFLNAQPELVTINSHIKRKDYSLE